MAIQIITPEDLEHFRLQLLTELRDLLINSRNPVNNKYLKSREVLKYLNVSPGTLQNLRITGKLNPTKIGGTMYYSMEEIQSLLQGK